MPPSVFQDRNPHSLHADLVAEVELYTEADRLVTMLKGWVPSSTSFPDMIKELAVHMAENRFWGKADVDLVTAWGAVRCTTLPERGLLIPTGNC